MERLCECKKTDGNPCTRVGSNKLGDDPKYCWQHQKCKIKVVIKKTIEPDEQKISIPVATIPVQKPQVPVPVSKIVPVSVQKIQISSINSGQDLLICGDHNTHQDFLRTLGGQQCWIFTNQHKEQLLQHFNLNIEDIKPFTQSKSQNIQMLTTKSGKGIWVCGDTLPHQDFLKSVGGKWNQSKKCWVFYIGKKEELMKYFNKKPEDINTQGIEDDTEETGKIQDIKLVITKSGKGVWVCGNTFPHLNKLKEFGGKWNAIKNCWVFTIDKKDELLSYFKLTIEDITFEEAEPAPAPENQINLYFDGASKGNPGPAGYGFYVNAPFANIDIKDSHHIDNSTNNFAEYSGLIAGLVKIKNIIIEHHMETPLNILIKGDSELVIKQMNNVYKVKDLVLAELHKSASSIVSELRYMGHIVTLTHIVRKYNSVADKLASDAALVK